MLGQVRLKLWQTRAIEQKNYLDSYYWALQGYIWSLCNLSEFPALNYVIVELVNKQKIKNEI